MSGYLSLLGRVPVRCGREWVGSKYGADSTSIATKKGRWWPVDFRPRRRRAEYMSYVLYISTYISHKDIKLAIRRTWMKVGFLISTKLSLNLKSDHFTSSFGQFKKDNKELTAHYEPNLTTTKPLAFIFLGVRSSSSTLKSISSKLVLGVA